MPELPEVETIRREMAKELKGKRFRRVEVRLAKAINWPVSRFTAGIRGAAIKGLSRRAKILIINLANGYSLLVHLKLTGQLIFEDKKGRQLPGGHDQPDPSVGQLPSKFTQAIFEFTDGSHLYFNDFRKFGYIKIFKTSELDNYFTELKLGPEPLDKAFTFKKFEALLKKKPNSKIKPLLMDQSFLAGLGNIYADEVCFKARVKPTRPVKSLSAKEIKDIFTAIKTILAKAIQARGTTFDHAYRDLYGQKGNYDRFLNSYGRAGAVCLRCRKGKIVRISLKGRSAFFCPACQK